MASLSWDLTRRDGVTLVELVVTAEAAEWVRVESRLQPVWPPRRQGVPVAGWDDACFEGRVGPESPLVLGYASPAGPVEPPAQLETPDVDGDPPPDGTGVSARAIVRALGESAPPRDVVPVDDAAAPTGGGVATATAAPSVESGSKPVDVTSEPADTVERPPPPESAGPATDSGPERDTEPVDGGAGAVETAAGASGLEAVGEPTEAIEPWFDAVEGRLAEAERLAGVTGVDEARGAVEAVGGIEAARDLRETLEADRRHLEALRERQQRLADRLAAVEIPLSTLERVT